VDASTINSFATRTGKLRETFSAEKIYSAYFASITKKNPVK